MISVLGYADRWSVAPGETITFMVSCEDGAQSFRADIVRMFCSDDSPQGPGVKVEVFDTPANASYAGHQQRTYGGSYALVPACAQLDSISDFTVAVMVWPTTPRKGRQGLVTKWLQDEGKGFALVIGDDGAAELILADGKRGAEVITSGQPLLARRWTFVAATYTATTSAVTLYQKPMTPPPYAPEAVWVERVVPRGIFVNSDSPLLIAAWHATTIGDRVVAGGHFNGKLEAPRLARHALGRAEVEELRKPPHRWGSGTGWIGAWDFSLDVDSNRITDRSSNGLHGHTVNLPARGARGARRSPEAAFGWRDQRELYGAIHFHDDDFADAGWEESFAFTLPGDFKSGVWAARLRNGEGIDYVPFFVRPKPGSATAATAFLAPTATYLAYGNTHAAYIDPFEEIKRGFLAELQPADLYLNQHRELGLSMYDTHSDGSDVFHASRHRPILNMRPGTRLWNFNADMHIIDWLHTKDFDADIITDEDLHHEGSKLLEPYRVVVTGTHPEYASREMLDALLDYRDRGGRLMYLGGNGFYWRTSFHPTTPGVMECRKVGASRSCDADPAEGYHAFTGERAGTWRRVGRAPQALVGVGMCAEGFDVCGYYLREPGSRDPRAAFIFEGIGEDERIGNFGVAGGGAAGLETDRMDYNLGTPANALLLASSHGLSRLYQLVPEEFDYVTTAITADENSMVRADMVFFECPNGGAVFSTGSIAWAASLSHDGYDNNVSRITENVLRRFLDEPPF